MTATTVAIAILALIAVAAAALVRVGGRRSRPPYYLPPDEDHGE